MSVSNKYLTLAREFFMEHGRDACGSCRRMVLSTDEPNVEQLAALLETVAVEAATKCYGCVTKKGDVS